MVCFVVLGGRVFFFLSRWRGHSTCSHEASVAIAGEWNTARRKRHSRRLATCGNGRGDRPEPCGLFVPNEDQVASVLAEHGRVPYNAAGWHIAVVVLRYFVAVPLCDFKYGGGNGADRCTGTRDRGV